MLDDDRSRQPGWSLDRRTWAKSAAAFVCGAAMPRVGQGIGDDPPASNSKADEQAPPAPAGESAQNLSPQDEEKLEFEQAREHADRATTRPLVEWRTERFQAIGDASLAFLKLTLADCEALASDFLDHYREKGFKVAAPPRRLTLVIFQDERPFRQFAPNLPSVVSGLYKRTENWLVLFDFRNAPRGSRPAAYANISTLAHEATHLLCYNYGLLKRDGDAPRSIVEGLATYAEEHRLHGREQPGKLNSMRLDDLAHVRRRIDWISLKTLLKDDRRVFASTLDRVLLGYAQSWLLIYYLMSTPETVVRLREYLEAISGRTDDTHRIQDAQARLGDLDRLDAQLRREAVRLQFAR